MNLTDTAEEVMERLWIETVEHDSAGCDIDAFDEDVVDEIIGEGLVTSQGGRIKLTPHGREEAGSCIRRHRLAERLMADVFVIKGKKVHETSCRFEHLLHKGIEENICTLLGHPRTCPHGSPIPEGKCCKSAKRASGRLIKPLTELDIDKRAAVAYLQTKENSAMQKIMAIGALPGTDIWLTQRFPSYVIKIGRSQFAIDKELAAQIYVRKT